MAGILPRRRKEAKIDDAELAVPTNEVLDARAEEGHKCCLDLSHKPTTEMHICTPFSEAMHGQTAPIGFTAARPAQLVCQVQSQFAVCFAPDATSQKWRMFKMASPVVCFSFDIHDQSPPVSRILPQK